MIRPLIVLTPSREPDPSNGGIDQIRVHKNYADSVNAAGGIAITASGAEGETDCLVEVADALLLTGGRDIEPMRYGEEKSPSCGTTDPWRDEMEWGLLNAFVQAEKPVMGICRGVQLINVYFGGTLTQALEDEGKPEHRNVIHQVETMEGSFLRELFGAKFLVNSFHHQAVRRLGRDIAVTARSGDVIEGIVHTRLPIFAVQWHPERMTGDKRYTSEGPSMDPLFSRWIEQINRNKETR